jgi:hypothetical protein
MKSGIGTTLGRTILGHIRHHRGKHLRLYCPNNHFGFFLQLKDFIYNSKTKKFTTWKISQTTKKVFIIGYSNLLLFSVVRHPIFLHGTKLFSDAVLTITCLGIMLPVICEVARDDVN